MSPNQIKAAADLKAAMLESMRLDPPPHRKKEPSRDEPTTEK